MLTSRSLLAFGFCVLLTYAQDWNGMGNGGDMVSPDMQNGGYGGDMNPNMGGGFDGGMGGGEMGEMGGYGGGYGPGNGQMGNFGGFPNGPGNQAFPTQ